MSISQSDITQLIVNSRQQCKPIYPEHDDSYLKECIANLKKK